MSADVGSKAPDFTLMNQDRQPVTLERAARPAGRAGVLSRRRSARCAQKELCTFRDSMARLNEANAQVYGISVDTFFTLKAFQDQQKLTFPLLSDFNKEVIRDYGVFNEDMIGLKGIAKRAVFVIDKDGVVRHREVLEDARNEPDYEKVFAALASLAGVGAGSWRLGARGLGLDACSAWAAGPASQPAASTCASIQPLAPSSRLGYY